MKTLIIITMLLTNVLFAQKVELNSSYSMYELESDSNYTWYVAATDSLVVSTIYEGFVLHMSINDNEIAETTRKDREIATASFGLKEQKLMWGRFYKFFRTVVERDSVFITSLMKECGMTYTYPNGISVGYNPFEEKEK